MSFELSLITNDLETVRIAEAAGVERILIDLERLGKRERQAGQNLFLSTHDEADVARIRGALRTARLTVRIDPLHSGSRRQIDRVIESGADFVMLPYFREPDEAQAFLDLVARRASPILLVETSQAASRLETLCRLSGVAEVHIGLNDLGLSLGKAFLFDAVADGTVDRLCEILREAAIPFGFGGLGHLARREMPVDPELILAAQVTQGATRGWLGRTFRELDRAKIPREIGRLRAAVACWKRATPLEVAAMRSRLQQQIFAVANRRAA